MFGLEFLDVAIGIIFVYLLLSLSGRRGSSAIRKQLPSSIASAVRCFLYPPTNPYATHKLILTNFLNPDGLR